MTQNRDQRTRLPRAQRMNDFIKALISTAIPFVVLVIVSALMAGSGGELVWALGLILCPVALLISGGFAIAGKRGIALGILAATAILVLGLMLSCSLVLATT